MSSNEIKDEMMGHNQIRMEKYTEEAYLDYAMYVILDRALPHVSDGLKPVQRRIVYAMSELGLKATSKYKKSARTIGDVIGKFHPHGDSACYEAMVLMAQDFSYRYPLVDGHGNWGSADDPKSFAAMRYTESRLTPYADLLLSELGQGTASWQPNFDGSISEPVGLPARVPNILLNGGSGIAVGMATDIPPHNMTEVLDAVIYLIQNPEASVEKLCEFIKAPDFPMGGDIITPQKDLIQMYKTGTGQIRQRGKHCCEKNSLVFYQLPFQASSSKIVKQVADAMVAKKLPGVVDVRDESDHEHKVRVVIELKSLSKFKDQTLAALFALTDIEKSMRANFNVIGLNKKPETKGLNKILTEWIFFRKQTMTRRIQFEYEKVKRRLEVLKGLLLVFIHIDQIIQIIRHQDEPKAALMDKFELSELQAEAILEMKLRQLASLEYLALEKEKERLEGREAELADLLSHQGHFNQLFIEEIKAIQEKHGDARRSELVDAPVHAYSVTKAVVPDFPVKVVVSKEGWVRTFRSLDQDEASLTFRSGDDLFTTFDGRSTQSCFILTTDGRMYNVPIHQMPGSRGYGEPLSKFVDLKSDVLSVGVLQAKDMWLICADSGYGFLLQSEQMVVTQKAGKAIFTLKDQETLLPLMATHTEAQLLMVTSQGRMLVCDMAAVNQLAKGRGVKLIGIKKEEYDHQKDRLNHVLSLLAGESGVLRSGSRHLNLDASRLESTQGVRASRGKLLPQGFRQVSGLEKTLKEQDDNKPETV
ncbi:DNA topoisomerase IV subunit A [Gammaproteobacteria bacterium]|nr:DNA topoisomerase IV subunit A [Gammaproteobacteria bacterium]